MNSTAGTLYIVATPIGNLKDISFRAVEVLKLVDLILVEDTRNAVKLLQHYNIKTPMRALHEHNEVTLSQDIVQQIIQGKHIALISDAGTPLISDPGFNLVHDAQIAGIQAITIPGACAAIAALSIAGLPTHRFTFEGFLPAKTAAREQRMQALVHEIRTLIFYESKHRINDFLASLQTIFGPTRKIVIARELTKLFESVYQGNLAEVRTQLLNDPQAQKGEFVVLVHGASQAPENLDLDQVLNVLLEKMGVSDASKLAAKITTVNKNQCYQRALILKSGEPEM